MNQNEIREYFSRSQQAERQKDRFGNIHFSIETLTPSSQDLSVLQQLVLAFCSEPLQHSDLLAEKSELLQYLPPPFVEQLTQSPFFMHLSQMLTMKEQIHKSLHIIAGCISAQSPFIESLLIFQSISIQLSSLPFIQVRSDENCSLLGLIDKIISEMPSSHPEIISAAEKCVTNILKIDLENISAKFNILKSFAKRIYSDYNQPDLLKEDYKVLLQVVEVGKFNISNTTTIIQQYIISPQYPIEFIKSNLILLSKIIMQYHLVMDFANNPFLNRMIQFLTDDFDFEMKANTLNVIEQIICQFTIFKETDRLNSPRFKKNPVDMLIDKNLFPLLIKFAQDFPKQMHFALNPVAALCTLAPRYVEMVCDNGFAELIPFAIQNCAFADMQSAILLASNIMYKGTSREIQLLLHPLILETMMQFIEEDTVLIRIILDGIYHGLQAEEENGDQSLRNVLQTEQFCSLLQTCTTNESEEASGLAQQILQMLATK